MSLVFNEKYPGKTAGATQNYPYGEARNVSGPGKGDGTPWDAALVNDFWGLLQGLLISADITPNGRSDTAIDSQYLLAIQTLISKAVSDAQPIHKDHYFLRFSGANGAILKDHGGLKVVRLGHGYYEVTLPVDAPDDNYMVFLTGAYGWGGASSINLANQSQFKQTKNKFRIVCNYGGDNTQGAYDPDFINVRVFY